MKVIYKRTYKNIYTIKESYMLVGGKSVFRQVKYYLHGQLVKNLICQLVSDLDQVDHLWDFCHMVNGCLWFDTIVRPATDSFDVVKSNSDNDYVYFKLNTTIISILEVLKNAR